MEEPTSDSDLCSSVPHLWQNVFSSSFLWRPGVCGGAASQSFRFLIDVVVLCLLTGPDPEDVRPRRAGIFTVLKEPLDDLRVPGREDAPARTRSSTNSIVSEEHHLTGPAGRLLQLPKKQILTDKTVVPMEGPQEVCRRTDETVE